METTFTEWVQITAVLLLIGGGFIGVILLAILPNWQYEEDEHVAETQTDFFDKYDKPVYDETSDDVDKNPSEVGVTRTYCA